MADIIYPLYIVIDASLSMNKEVNGKRRIDLAREIPLSLLRLYEEDNSLVSSVYVSVLTFNTEVKVLSELGEIPKLLKLPKEITAESKTYFGQVFSTLYERINADFERLSGANKFMKPSVLMVTDGGPNDDKDERHAAFRKLIPVSKQTNKPDRTIFPLWPQIIMLGIDVANETVLQAYSFKNNHYYKASDALAIDEQIRAIARQVKDAVSSTMAAPDIQTDDQEPWLRFLGKATDDDDDSDDFSVDDLGNFF
jgi:uncharacterized protein YegL